MGGRGGGGPWGVAEEAVPYMSRRWSVQVVGEAVRAGRGGGGPWGVTEEAVPYMSRRWSVQVVGEAVRAGHGVGGPCTPPRKPHSEIQNLTGVFGFLSYEKIVYRHKT